MKKLLLLICIGISFLLTGCSVNYNLYIEKDSITESIDAYLPDTKENRDYVNILKKNRQSAYFEMNNNRTYYYKMEYENVDNMLKLNYEYQYLNSVKLQNSNALSRCYYNNSVVTAGDFLTLSTSDQVTCIYKDGEKQVDKINVNIITDLKVEEHNADHKSGNRYTWNITDKNYQKKPIYIKINTNTKKQDAEMTKKEREQLLILVGILIAVVSIVICRLYIINRRNNHFK